MFSVARLCGYGHVPARLEEVVVSRRPEGQLCMCLLKRHTRATSERLTAGGASSRCLQKAHHA